MEQPPVDRFHAFEAQVAQFDAAKCQAGVARRVRHDPSSNPLRNLNIRDESRDTQGTDSLTVNGCWFHIPYF